MVWEWDILTGQRAQPDMGWSPWLMSDLEKTVDLEEFFSNNKELDQPSTLESQNLVNVDNEKKALNSSVEIQDNLLITNEAWALLSEVEAFKEHPETIGIYSPITPPTPSPLPAPLDDSFESSWEELPQIMVSAAGELINEQTSHELQIGLIKDTLLSKSSEINEDKMLVYSGHSEIVQTFKDEVPPSAGVEFPLDISTPDVLSLLVEFPEDIPSPDLKTIQEDDIAVKQNAFLFPQIPIKEEEPSSCLLSLKIGSKAQVGATLGNGALLQRKRKASRSSLGTTEVKVIKLSSDGENFINCESNSGDAGSSCFSTSVLKISETTVDVGSAASSSVDNGTIFVKPLTPTNVKHIEMRIKNNEASRRSRKSRKHKEQEMEELSAELEKENSLLQIKVERLEKLTEFLKAELIKIVSNKK